MSSYSWRKKILKRDNNICQNCRGRIKDDYRKKTFSLEAHHIIPQRHGGRNTPENGITLCRHCHQYFDHMYTVSGLDYHQIMARKSKEQRLEEIRELMRRRFIKFLMRKIFYE